MAAGDAGQGARIGTRMASQRLPLLRRSLVRQWRRPSPVRPSDWRPNGRRRYRLTLKVGVVNSNFRLPLDGPVGTIREAMPTTVTERGMTEVGAIPVAASGAVGVPAGVEVAPTKACGLRCPSSRCLPPRGGVEVGGAVQFPSVVALRGAWEATTAMVPPVLRRA